MAYRQNTGGGVVPVRAASTANAIIASALINGAAFGGVTLVTGDLVLLKDQTVASENGIYTVVVSGAATRSAKMQTASDAFGALISVRNGNSLATTYSQTADPAIVGTGSLSFAALSQGSLAEYGRTVYAGAAVIPTSTVTDFMTFTLPSAGVWDVAYTVRAQATSTGNTTTGIQAAVYTSANSLVSGTETLVSFLDSNVASTMSVAGTGSGTVQITTTGAATYKVRVWNNNNTGLSSASSTGLGRSYVTWKKIDGQNPVSGQMVDTLYVTRAGSDQSQATNWTSRDIIFNTLAAGNIPYNVATGVATLTAGKTYNIRAGLAWNCGSTYLIQWALVDGASNTLLSQTVEQIQASRSTFYVGTDNLDFTFTPTTNQTVKIRTNASTNMLSGEALRADFNTFMQITQVGSTSYSGTTIIGTPTAGQVLTAQADGTTAIWQNVTAPTNTSVEFSYVKNSVAQTVVSGSPFSFDTVMGGTITRPTNFSFLLLAGKTYKLEGSPGASGAGGNLNFQWRDATNSVYLGNAGTRTPPTSTFGNSVDTTNAVAIVTPVANMLVQFWATSTSGAPWGQGAVDSPNSFSYVHIVQLGSTAYSGITIAGTPTAGQTLVALADGVTANWQTPGTLSSTSVSYSNVKHSTMQVVASGSPFIFDTVLGGSIVRPATTSFQLLAGITYRLEGNPGGSDSTAAVLFQWRDITNSVYVGNTAVRIPPSAGNTISLDTASAIAIYTPTTNVVVQLWAVTGSTTAWGQGNPGSANSYSYANIVQLGSTAYSGTLLTGTPTANQIAVVNAGGTSAAWTTLTGGVTNVAGVTTVVTNANLTGSVTSVGNATTVITNANSTGMVTSVGNATTVVTNANLTGMVTSVGNAATVVTNANLTGMVTSAGNASTVVTNANLTGAVTSVGNATSVAVVQVSNDTPVGMMAGTSAALIAAMSISATGTYSVNVKANMQTLLRPAEMVSQAAIDLTALNTAITNITTPSITGQSATISNVTLVPGVYNFGTTAISLSGTITLSGTATDYWIFKTTGALASVASNLTMTMGGTATAANVFWLIGNNAPSLGANTSFKGTILNTAAIALPASINFEGRLLTTAGAISVGAGSALYVPAGACTCAAMGVLSTFLAFTSAGANSTTSTVVAYGDVGSKDTAVATWAANNLSGSSYGPGTLNARAVYSLYVAGTLVPFSARTVDFIRSTLQPVTLEATAAVTSGQAIECRQLVMCGSTMVTNKMLSVTRLT